jgi:hypothetical protein
MQTTVRIVGVLFCAALPASDTYGANMTGTVKGLDGGPFMGAFVVAENTKNKMTVSVLSEKMDDNIWTICLRWRRHGQEHRRVVRRSG